MNFHGYPFWEHARHRGRMRRGLLPFLLLRMLAEGPRHGYDVMREFKERGHWRPGPGSVYPTLAALEAAGYVVSREEDGKRVYVITDAGVQHLKANGAHADAAMPPDEDAAAPVRDAMQKLHAAVRQAATGSEQTAARAIEILNSARKEIYTLLANE